MGGNRNGEPNVGERGISRGCFFLHGVVGEEEGGEVSEGIWQAVYEEEICVLTWYILSIARKVGKTVHA